MKFIKILLNHCLRRIAKDTARWRSIDKHVSQRLFHYRAFMPVQLHQFSTVVGKAVLGYHRPSLRISEDNSSPNCIRKSQRFWVSNQSESTLATHREMDLLNYDIDRENFHKMSPPYCMDQSITYGVFINIKNNKRRSG